MYDTTIHLPGDVKDNEKTIKPIATRKISKISLPKAKDFGQLQKVIVDAILKFHQRKPPLNNAAQGISLLWKQYFASDTSDQISIGVNHLQNIVRDRKSFRIFSGIFGLFQIFGIFGFLLGFIRKLYPYSDFSLIFIVDSH